MHKSTLKQYIVEFATLAAIISFPVQADIWTNTQQSISPHSLSTTATLLNNGNVLVVDGYAENNNAELYNPSNETWTTSGTRIITRRDHRAILLKNGKVLLIGGSALRYKYPELISEIYNPATRTWNISGVMNSGCMECTAILLKNGKVLVMGGADDERADSSNAEIYDPATETWTITSPMSKARRNPIAVLLKNGKVLVMGGYYNYYGRAGYTDLAEMYNPITSTWTVMLKQPPTLEAHTATLLENGKVLFSKHQV